MRNSLLMCSFLCICFTLTAQLDDRPFQFDRNVITAGFGSHASGPRTIYNKNYEIEYERYVDKFYSVSAIYKYMENEFFARTSNAREYHANLNYYPFTNLRWGLLKVGLGVNVSQNSIQYFEAYRTNTIRIYRRSSGLDYGLNGMVEYRIQLYRNLKIGLKAYSQFNTYDQLEFGWILKTGVAF